MLNGSLASAVRDFHRARRRAGLETILAHLTGKPAELLSYDEVRQKLRAREGATRGLQEIPLDAIVGSVGRYDDFTRSFLPRQDNDEQRWARVMAAMNQQEGLPPIEVYQIGDVYFVLDGNHRVSAARQLGAKYIEAYVTEVRTKVPLTPDVQPDDLIIKERYVEFLERTKLDQLRPQADLTVTVPGQYRIIEEHIEVHRYFMGIEQSRPIPYEEAVAHWYDEVYMPVIEAIRQLDILRDFPGRTETDLYIWVMEHRAALMEAWGLEVEPGEAAIDLANQRGRSPRRVVSRMAEKVLDAVTPDELESGPPPGQWRQVQVRARSGERLFADVLVPVSGTEAGWHALEQAVEIAKREGARLSGLHVVQTEEMAESEAVQVLQAEFNQRCEKAGIEAVFRVDVGGVARKICEWARWIDLVTVGLTHVPAPRPTARLSSGFRTLLQRAPTPVLVVQGPPPALKRALLAYDGSPKAQEALFVATYLAGRWEIPLVVVNVGKANGETADLLEEARTYLEEHEVAATYERATGAVGPALLEVAARVDSDFIIMGGYGFKAPLHAVLGSTVDWVLCETKMPVLVCR